MRVAIDSRFLLPHLEGFGRFTREIASRLIQQYPEVSWELLFDRPPLPKYTFGPTQRNVVIPPQTRHWTLYEIWWHLSVPFFYLRKGAPSALFATYGIVSKKVAEKVPTVAFIHDVAFARHPEFLPRDWQAYYMRATRLSTRFAQRLITNSLSVQHDLVELFGVNPEKIQVSYSGCDTEFFHPMPNLDREAIRRAHAQGYPYILYVGSIHPRKNPERLLLAYDKLREKYDAPLRLLMVGRFMFKERTALSSLARMRHREEVIFHPPVSDEVLLRMYNAAEAVVYPSLYEGFGSPVAEGLACGVPVVTSRVSSLPETGGEAAFYADPYDPVSIAEAIYQALTQSADERRRRALLGLEHVKRFSWNATVQTIWENLKAIAV
ncbi:MAG: glycosyltransferase family 4 protein [Bacteroidia bacterium]|nr:glycosyltransferase family 4 protein [Bacteroidia bacterium]